MRLARIGPAAVQAGWCVGTAHNPASSSSSAWPCSRPGQRRARSDWLLPPDEAIGRELTPPSARVETISMAAWTSLFLRDVVPSLKSDHPAGQPALPVAVDEKGQDLRSTATQLSRSPAVLHQWAPGSIRASSYILRPVGSRGAARMMYSALTREAPAGRCPITAPTRSAGILRSRRRHRTAVQADMVALPRDGVRGLDRGNAPEAEGDLPSGGALAWLGGGRRRSSSAYRASSADGSRCAGVLTTSGRCGCAPGMTNGSPSPAPLTTAAARCPSAPPTPTSSQPLITAFSVDKPAIARTGRSRSPSAHRRPATPPSDPAPQGQADRQLDPQDRFTQP